MTTVIGSVTAGHGMVQDYYTIATDGAAIRLSVASLVLKRAAKSRTQGYAEQGSPADAGTGGETGATDR